MSITLLPGQIAVPTDGSGNIALLKNLPPTVAVSQIGTSTYQLTVSLYFTPAHENNTGSPITIPDDDFYVCSIGNINNSVDSKKILIKAENDLSGKAFLNTSIVLTTGVKTNHGS